MRGHIKDLAQECKKNRGTVKLDKKRWVELKSFVTSLRTALTYGLGVWANKEEIKELERIQGKTLKGIYISTANNNIYS